MPRKKPNKTDPEVASIKHSRDRENAITDMITDQSKQVPNHISKEVALTYEGFHEERLSMVAKLKEIVVKAEKKLDTIPEANLRDYMAVLKELRHSVQAESDSLDNACKHYHDPKEQGMDTELNITIGYEAK